MKISLLTPTRFRPLQMEHLIKSAYLLSNWKHGIEFIFYVDLDDTVSINTLVRLSNFYPLRWVEGERIVLSQMWNECYKEASGEIMMHCGDDIVFGTDGWDDIVRKAFEEYDDRIVLVYGNDCIHGPNLATHSFLHRNWIETVGYFLPPYFVSDYNDTWLTDVARKINRLKYVPELITEHMHFSVGKASMDLNTQERLERARLNNPGKIYEEKEIERIDGARKLTNFIQEFKKWT